MANVATRIQPDHVVIAVNSDFVFNVNSEFRAAYKDQPPRTRFVVDVRGARYMDSSGLGMLLQLREHAGGDAARISIRGCNDVIRDILKVANFDRLFQMEC